jgi:hypothetical protein
VPDDVVTRARALLAAATPGPWRVDDPPVNGGHFVVGDGHDMVAETCPEHDAALIAAAPTLLAELADLVAKLQSDMDGDRSLMERLRIERNEARAEVEYLRRRVVEYEPAKTLPEPRRWICPTCKDPECG